MSGNSKAINVRIAITSASGAGGQRAHDMRIGAQPDYVDATRTNLNRVLITPCSGIQLREICEQRREKRETKRAMKKNAGVCMSGVITFGHDAQIVFDELTPDQQDRAYTDVAKAVADRLKTTVTGLVVHKDEAANHAHFQCAGFDFDGNPIGQTAKVVVLSQLQTIAAEVIGRYSSEIERGKPKKERLAEGENYADVVHKSAAQMRALLPAELEAKKALLAEVEAKIEKNERLAARALEKARENEDKAEKSLKNAEIYEKRAALARFEKEKIERQRNEIDSDLKLRKAAMEAHELLNATNVKKIHETRQRLDMEQIELSKRKSDIVLKETNLKLRESLLDKNTAILNNRNDELAFEEFDLSQRVEENKDAVFVYNSLKKFGKNESMALTRTFIIIYDHLKTINLSHEYNISTNNLFNNFLKVLKIIDISNGYKFNKQPSRPDKDRGMEID